VESIKQENPSIDYLPCSLTNGNDVVCNEVPLKEVQTVFKQTPIPRLASVTLTLKPHIFNEKFIPENVFGTKQILDIWIEYSSEGNKLEVDANAFRSTKSYTVKFSINIIDCTYLDLGFLSGFDQLTQLNLFNINNIQHCLPSLSSLPRLTSLYIRHCSGMNEFYNFPALINGLKHFSILNYDGPTTEFHSNLIINDETVDRIIDWLLLSSDNTLEEMEIANMNQVTFVPHKIASFKALRKVWIPRNNISTIKSGAFSFSVPVSLLGIHGNGIKEIEPGAFQGKHHNFMYIA